MLKKEMRSCRGGGQFRLTAFEDGKNRWLELPACKIEDDGDIESLTKLLAKTISFLDGDEDINDLEEIV